MTGLEVSMGCRRMSRREASGAREMAKAKLEGGQDPDSVAADIARWLRVRGWLERPAEKRSTDLVRELLAARDGVAGSGAAFL